MSNEVAAPPRQRGAVAGRVVRLISLLVLLVGAGFYLRELRGNLDLALPRTRVPLAPLELPPELLPASDLGVLSGAAAGRDLVLITLDTTRPYRLGLYGNRAIETPNLDRLGREGVVFSRAVATAPVTQPTHTSIFTGLYSYAHGVRANGFFTPGVTPPTLTEILAAQGYDTAAFVSSAALDASLGLDRGFGVYDDHVDPTKVKMGYSDRAGDVTTDLAIAWLRRPRTGPYFLWVHYFDPHAKYKPPEPYASQSTNLYDGEIAFMDAQIGRLLDAVAAASQRDPLVVVTGDHGEALGEHNEDSHAYLVQEATLKIPLILSAPGVLPKGRRIDGRASQIDLLPTILSLLGIGAPAGLHGNDWTRSPAPDRAVMAETVEGRVNFGWRRLSALYLGDLKLVSGPTPELYDLARDPTESQNLAAANPDLVARLESRLRALRSGEPDALVPVKSAIDDATSQQLAALGYIVTEQRTISASGPGPDPRDVMSTMRRVKLTANAPDNGADTPTWVRLVARMQGIELPRNTEEAITALEALADRDPDFAPTLHFLSEFYRRAQRPDDLERTRKRLDALSSAASGAEG